MWTVLGVAFAAAPLLVWWALARTRAVGVTVGGTLLVCSGLLVAAQQGWADWPRADAHLLHMVLALLLISSGSALERRAAGPASPAWTSVRKKAVVLLRVQFALTLAGAAFYVLITSEASVPDANKVPPLPPGLTALEEGDSCGSGSCARLVEVGSTQGLSREEILRRLDRPHETCRPNGWLLDRRDLCVGISGNADKVVLYVSLSGLLD